MEMAMEMPAARNAPGARQTAWVSNGIRTELVVIPYADRTFVIVTQLKKLGTLVMATSDTAGGMMGGSRGRRYSVQVLLGRRDDPLLSLYARQMLEQMKSEKPLLLAIGLKEEGRDTQTFQDVINQLKSMPQTTIHKLGSPRKLTGECNTWDVIWALQVNGTVHQISMKRRFSQKLAVKHNGKTLLDKTFVFSKPYEGYCFVAWASEGVNFGIYYNTPLRSILTNADHYDLRVNGTNFVDLPDGCRIRDSQRKMALGRSCASIVPSNDYATRENLKRSLKKERTGDREHPEPDPRSASVPAMSGSGVNASAGSGSGDTNKNGNDRVASRRRNSTSSVVASSRKSVLEGGAAPSRAGSASHLTT